MLFKKIKNIIKKEKSKEEPEKSRWEEILNKIDKSLTRNEIRADKIKKEIFQLEKLELSDIEKIKQGSLSKYEEKFSLRNIKKIRKKIKNLEDALSVHEKNISTNLELIGKIENIQAMNMVGVTEEEIDDIVVDFEAELELYQENTELEETDEELSFVKKEEKELLDLKEQILNISNETNNELKENSSQKSKDNQIKYSIEEEYET